ncbi:hypothetical protein D3C81_948870 [compost metagenome]
MGLHTGGPQCVLDFIGQFFARQVQGRAVHGDLQVITALARQLAQILAGLAQHPVVQLGDQAIGFGDGDKTIRYEETVDRVLPADQGFELAHLTGLEVIDGLVIEHQAGVFTQGVAQLFFQLQLECGAGFQVGTEKTQPVPAATLGLIQRQIGVFQQFLAGLAVFRKQADADAGGHDHAPAGQLDGLLHFQHDALGHLPRFVTITQVDEQAELVAAEASDHILMTANRALDVPGKHFEQFVTGIVAKAVVDPLEMVDVQEHDRQHPAFVGFLDEFFSEDLVEPAAVDQVGQRIVVRQLLQRHARLVKLA